MDKIKELISLKLTPPKLKNGLVRKTQQLQIIDIQNTTFENDSLVSKNNDTNIILKLSTHAKYLKVVTNIIAEDKNAQTQLFYRADDENFTEENSIRLGTNETNIQYIVSASPISHIRLDAINTNGNFDINYFEVLKISKSEYKLAQRLNTVKKIRAKIKQDSSLIKKFISSVKHNGLKQSILKVKAQLHKSEIEEKYDIKYTYIEPNLTTEIKKEMNSFLQKPLISIIMPVYNVDPKWLDLAIKSIEKQWYENWELCIADDKSTKQETINYLKNINNPKIKIKFLDQNLNISGASNAALELACGEYLALMDNDDEITPDALYEVVKAINETGAEFIYSDEDKMNMEGNCLNPYFKPDYSYDLLLSLNYICHFSVIKKSIIDEIKGFNTKYNGAQDYDLFLRVIEKTNKIYHVPKVLYHWRMIETSTAMSSAAKPYAHDAGKKAVQSHFDRMDIRATVIDSEYTFVLDVDYEMPNINPLVSIIIPTKDAVNYLETCINSIVNLSTYKNYEILILNNNSEKEETFEWFKKVQQKYSFVKIIEANYEFNWSKLNNHGIKESKGDVFIFLNNDIEVITPNWIERLASKSLQPNVGTVGALLLFEDNTIQHSGVVVGLNGWADHLYRTAQPVHLHINYTSPMVNKNVLAVTGACVAISKKTIENIGNFSEDFLICGSDVEICLRAHENGYRNILDANTKLYHFESKTRSSFVPECDFEMSRKAYKYYWENGDPFYNINLSLNGYLPNIRNLNEN
ncbi:glycosyltransferase family 2 protein [Aliarcobacter butzleri]|uniref:glycosyltransferase family 2 protein n=1 Tax=Aliarcobacter butzleri TaxID=28197 RepID=UPI0021B165EE|nr:glycosyltransferase [Aliarcobacter butzleri]MCT7593184.1 glycosyltransferase [Aliarcobacter butzleri]MCT7633071.1 glycosyltransferase [Aliarcobacter butzleri]